MSLSIRRATVGDARTLSALAEKAFVEAFGQLYSDEDLQMFLNDAYAVDKQATILAHPDYAVWFLEHDGVPVGHAAAGPCGLPHDDVRPGDGELKRLYILQAFQNTGWGGRMFETVQAWLDRNGPCTQWIGVWSENPGAQKFYGRYGFERVGTYEFPVGRVRDLEYILRRPARHVAQG